MLLSGKINNYASKEIIDEIRDVIERDKIRSRLTLQSRRFIIDNLEKSSEIISPQIKLEIIKDDPKDNKFLEFAVEANADIIISGDEYLLNIKEFLGIKIVSPRDFIG